METLIPNDDEQGFGEGIPDNPHVQIMFDALDDTIEQAVTGNEGLSLTSSQIYAGAVLSTNGVRNVAGNEGFFSSIANAAKAVYDYIVKMFKAVWGFFFNRDAAKETAKSTDDVKEDQKKLEDLKQTKPEAVKGAQHFVANAKKADNDTIDLDKDTLEQIMVKMESGKPAEEKAAVVELINKLPKANKKGQEGYHVASSKVIATKKRFLSILEAAQKKPTGDTTGNDVGDVEETAKSILAAAVKSKAVEESFIKVLENHKDINSIADAEVVGKAILGSLAETKSLVERFKGHTSRVQSDVNDAKKAVDEINSTTNEQVANARKRHLAAVRHVLGFTSAIAQVIKKSNEELVTLQKRVNGIFGIK